MKTKKTIFFIISIAFLHGYIYSQKNELTISQNHEFTQVDAGVDHVFSTRTKKRNLIFHLDWLGKVKGEINITDIQDSSLIFKGFIKNEQLVDSAMWYRNGKLIQLTRFSDVSDKNIYYSPGVEPIMNLDPKVFIRGVQNGAETLYSKTYPHDLASIHHYLNGKLDGKQYEYGYKEALINIRTYKNGKLNDTSWLKCAFPKPDITIYKNGQEAGIWKLYDSEGNLVEERWYIGNDDSSVYYNSGKIQSFQYKTNTHGYSHIYRKYDSAFQLRLKYEVREVNGQEVYKGNYKLYDTLGRISKNCSYYDGFLNGKYEEYINGKLIVKGTYLLGEKKETWYTYNTSGKIIKTEKFAPIDYSDASETMISKEIGAADMVEAMWTFPSYQSIKYTPIRIAKTNDKKILTLLKKYSHVSWRIYIDKKSAYYISCDDVRLKQKEKDLLINYLMANITEVKAVEYESTPVKCYSQYSISYY